MDVLIDGTQKFQLTGEPKDVLAVVSQVVDVLRSQGRGILSLQVDGTNIPSHELLDALEDMTLDQVSRIDVASAEIENLVQEYLEGIQEVLPELPIACRHLAQIFQGEAPEEGFEPFQEVAQIWSYIKNCENMVANALDIKLDTLQIDGKPVMELHEELNGFLEEALQALKDGDCVLLGDLLEYELAPRAEKEVDIIALLSGQSPAPS